MWPYQDAESKHLLEQKRMGVGCRGGVIREMSLSRLDFYSVFPSLCRKLNHAPQRQRAERKEAWAPILAHLLIRYGCCIPLYFLFLAVKRELAPLTIQNSVIPSRVKAD